jgi:hypothetical protein
MDAAWFILVGGAILCWPQMHLPKMPDVFAFAQTLRAAYSPPPADPPKEMLELLKELKDV